MGLRVRFFISRANLCTQIVVNEFEKVQAVLVFGSFIFPFAANKKQANMQRPFSTIEATTQLSKCHTLCFYSCLAHRHGTLFYFFALGAVRGRFDGHAIDKYLDTLHWAISRKLRVFPRSRLVLTIMKQCLRFWEKMHPGRPLPLDVTLKVLSESVVAAFYQGYDTVKSRVPFVDFVMQVTYNYINQLVPNHNEDLQMGYGTPKRPFFIL